MHDDDANAEESPVEPTPAVPDFELVREIGRGGFGTVWLARNRTTGHLRAVKLIALRAGRANPAAREITSLVRLEANLGRQHPNLLPIYHVGRTEAYLFYVMDLADDRSGGAGADAPEYQPATLENRLKNGPLSPEACLDLARELLSGLASLHAVGMVHRDVKPANCLFVGGQLKLADFGLLTEARAEVSQVGTRRYMPPDGHMDMRADVYAAGLVIYQMITGLPVEEFPRLGSSARRVANEPALAALLRLALDACQHERAARPADARVMLARLESRGAGKRSARGRRWVAMLVFGVAAVLGIVGAFWAMGPAEVSVNFITRPAEAAIRLDDVLLTGSDGAPLRTPCTVDGLLAQRHHIRFEPADGPAWDAGQYDFRGTRQIVSTRDTAQ